MIFRAVYAAFTPEETRDAIDNLPPVVVDTSYCKRRFNERNKGSWAWPEREQQPRGAVYFWTRRLIVSLFYRYVLQTLVGKVAIIVGISAGMYDHFC